VAPDAAAAEQTFALLRWKLLWPLLVHDESPRVWIAIRIETDRIETKIRMAAMVAQRS
jgi:hypothetical protein